MNAARKPTGLQIVASGENSATRRLHLLVGQRATLRPAFRSAWEDLARHFEPDELEAWADAVLTLVHVNAGPACLMAYWEFARLAAGEQGITSLSSAAQSAAEICRSAGRDAATASLMAVPIAVRQFGSGPALRRWWHAMENLARQAPESVALAASRMAEIVGPGTIEAFENFVSAGLRAASGNKARRIAFFSLNDEFAQRLITRDHGALTLIEIEVELKAFITALWGRSPLLRALPADSRHTPQRRVSIAGPVIRLPETFRGVRDEAARALFRAAAAHAQAHLVLGRYPFPAGKLKPLQLALVTLVEDARIELLAMRQFPGLRRLWSSYHVAVPSGVAATPNLLARLSRALFDSAYEDDNSFVTKGRAMFAAALPRIDDPAICREIGVLLGNDLGQMRVQFNPKSYVVEPVYRDDGLGLWDFGEDMPPSGETIEVVSEAVRIEQKETSGSDNIKTDLQANQESLGRARPVAPDKRGVIIARYPEWDREHNIERPEWTVVREVPANVGDPRLIEEALDRAEVLRGRVGQLVRGVKKSPTHSEMMSPTIPG